VARGLTAHVAALKSVRPDSSSVSMEPERVGLSRRGKTIMTATFLVVGLLVVGIAADSFFNPTRTAPAPPAPVRRTWHMAVDYGGPSGPIKGMNASLQLRGIQNYLNWSYSTSSPDDALFAVSIYYPTGFEREVACVAGVSTSTTDPNCQVSYCYLYDCKTNYLGNVALNLPQGNYTIQTVAVIGSWHVSVSDYY
jgi:hypothetical protein